MEEKKNYITGLKGLSCILVMVGHFLGLYKYAQHFLPNISLLDTILNSKFSFVLDEVYWLYLFFYISGYLIAKSQLKTVKDVVFKIINRFFRFAFPILFSYLVIYLIYILIGFHNGNTISLFQCNWFQKFYSYQYSIVNVFSGPFDVLFLGKCFLNEPYWVLREMFVASMIIYILKFCYLSISKRDQTLCFLFFIIIAFAFLFISPVIFACMLGMLISIYETIDGILSKLYFKFGILFILVLQHILFHNYIFNAFFILLIIFVPKVRFMDNILSSKPVKFLGDISWGVYSFHWPLMCSLGALLIIKLQSEIGLLASYVIACGVVLLVTLIISILFKNTFERLSSYLSLIINTGLKKFACRLSSLKN